MLNLHDRLISSLCALNDRHELNYLIEALSERKVNSYAEAAILIFLLTYSHPRVMSDFQHQELQKLCVDCFLHATPNQLLFILNKPQNQAVKKLFDQFIEYAVKSNKLQLQKSVSPFPRRGKVGKGG